MCSEMYDVKQVG